MKVCRYYDIVIRRVYGRYQVPVPVWFCDLMRNYNYVMCLFHPCTCGEIQRCVFKKEIRDSISVLQSKPVSSFK